METMGLMINYERMDGRGWVNYFIGRSKLEILFQTEFPLTTMVLNYRGSIKIIGVLCRLLDNDRMISFFHLQKKRRLNRMDDLYIDFFRASSSIGTVETGEFFLFSTFSSLLSFSLIVNNVTLDDSEGLTNGFVH